MNDREAAFSNVSLPFDLLDLSKSINCGKPSNKEKVKTKSSETSKSRNTTTTMFSRAPRFEAEKDNGLPGPAAYAPASPASKKRGAFLEKEEWWKESKPDTGKHRCRLSKPC